MNGKRRRRSSCIKKVEMQAEGQVREEKNYAPTESEIHNPMEQASVGLARKVMEINRQEHI